MSWSVTSIKAIEYLFKFKKKTQPKDEFVDLFFLITALTMTWQCMGPMCLSLSLFFIV